jgi:WD40 repeat protein
MPTLKAQLHRTLTGRAAPGREVAFSPDGQELASSSVDGSVRLWKASDGTLLQTLTHPEGVTSIAFSPDGQALVSGGYDSTVKMWRLRDGVLARTLAGHRGTVWSVAFSPDGQCVASSGEDKTVSFGASATALSSGPS